MVSKKQKSDDSTASPGAGGLDQISNFFILPLHMPSLTLSHKSSSAYKNILHYLYFKKHESPKEDSKTPKNRTLFVLNVPADSSESHLRELFKPCGRVVSVQFLNRVRENSLLTKEEREQQEELERLETEAALAEAQAAAGAGTKGKKGAKKQQQATVPAEDEHRRLYATGSQAYVVFLEEQELDKALAMKRKKRTWINTGSDATSADAAKLSGLGVSKWLNEYHTRRPEASVLQVRVDDYMDKFERSEYETQQAALARHNVMDDDGFTLVTRAGSKGQNSDGVITITAAKAEEVKNLKPKKKELQDFYRFQMREAKRDKLVDLRRKFEEDKLRIEALKVNKRFKPY